MENSSIALPNAFLHNDPLTARPWGAGSVVATMAATMNRSNITRAMNMSAIIACMVVAITFILSRVVVRWKAAHGFALDDYFCWAALVFYLAYSGL